MRTVALNSTAKRFAEMLFAVYPAWERYAAVDEHLFAPRGCLLFQVPCPSASVEQPLSIYTSPDEITVGFDTGHSHFAEVKDAVEHIRSIVEESVVVESWFDGSRFLGCTQVAPDSATQIPDFIRAATRVRRRSWRGSHDIDTEVA